VIFESSFWKDDLLRSAKQLRRKALQRRWPEASVANLEQSLMLGFYSIRKIIEARRISDSLMDRDVKLVQFPALPRARITRINRLSVERHYDLESPHDVGRKMEFLCNQLVHSYIFITVFGEERGVDSFLFVSDRERAKGLYSISLDQVVSIFEGVGNNYPDACQYKWNAGRGDYDVSSA
jgi:hypothetical protein